MAIEIEKKYRLTKQQREQIVARLNTVADQASDVTFEVNTIYRSPALEADRAILRLRRIGDRSILTYKKRFESASPVKRQLEEETEILDGAVMESILLRLGFTPAVVYEKRRRTWKYAGTEVVVDELPFGEFMEIEGDEEAIQAVELALGIADLPAEEATYVGLTNKLGVRNGDVIEARFPQT